MTTTVLVSGGCGYIGSHTCLELLKDGDEVIIVDDLSNSKVEVVRRIEELSGKTVHFYQASVLDKQAVRQIFDKHRPDAVIHFAGFKAVGESVAQPLAYYRNNLDSTLTLCEVMQEFDCTRFVFSSSATVYGIPESVPIKETAQLYCTNPYGWSKLMNEQILRDIQSASPNWSVALLRYFNPIGAHESGRIGEDPKGVPSNLLPYITQVAVGRLEKVHVFGDNYQTIDGTGVRDYIHVVDLARGHSRAIDFVMRHNGCEAINLGTGEGYSVLQMIRAFEQANNLTIPYVIDPRRPGDIAACYANPKKAWELLGWRAEKSLEDMCRDAWNWQRKNPQGY